ncbi:aspartate--tRNA ligase 2, cytoplasmic-like [Lolium rigidum]|uniref:aspartate--tRNA ligase 2, cytoplasmic-like n=1 Tax=Lolium rigidum TaxID=89674 RepID=UPI001F5E06BC|nr:aspartate--tRNA ligase 2, cytoplasmic-like [Lolium rigidum]
MSSEPPPTPASASTEELEADLSAATISKKQLNKEARKAAKAAKADKAGKAEKPQAEEADPFAANYGDVPVEEIQSKAVSGRAWTHVGDLDQAAAGRSVLIRGSAQLFRPVSKKMAFLVLRQCMSTVQCVLVASADAGVSTQMVRFATSLSKESIVDVEGVVSIPKEPLKATTQQVEIQVRKVYCINRAIPTLPINLEDAARSEAEFEKAEQTGEKLVRVLQDTRLNYRSIDLRTPANQAIFRIQSQVENKFREYLSSKDFIGIHSPKLISGSSEGGAAVFKLQYNGQPACLAQSPQLYKQMAICGGFGRVFEVGPVFRAENSNTHRHLCEFMGLDAEMEIKEHYFEVCDIIDGLFVAIFKHLNENCKRELETINRQYPFEPLKYLEKTLKLTYAEGIQMLKEAGTEIDPMGDLNTESEKKLGRLVKEKYGTEFFILYRYPLAVRPFYTMPCYDDPAYSNSFDVFIRGEEIISGAQRVHTPELLRKRAIECGIDANTISSYIESFSYGAPPHGGFGVGLERVVMLFCALNNIRKTSLFPRDPQRLTP